MSQQQMFQQQYQNQFSRFANWDGPHTAMVKRQIAARKRSLSLTRGTHPAMKKGKQTIKDLFAKLGQLPLAVPAEDEKAVTADVKAVYMAAGLIPPSIVLFVDGPKDLKKEKKDPRATLYTALIGGQYLMSPQSEEPQAGQVVEQSNMSAMAITGSYGRATPSLAPIFARSVKLLGKKKEITDEKRSVYLLLQDLLKAQKISTIPKEADLSLVLPSVEPRRMCPLLAAIEIVEDDDLRESFRPLKRLMERRVGALIPFPGLDMCAIAQPAARFHTEPGTGRVHNEVGPSVEFRNGTKLYHLAGIPVTKKVVMEPEKLTTMEVLREKNLEVRRIMLARYGGMPRLAKDMGAKVIDIGPRGTLYSLDISNGVKLPNGENMQPATVAQLFTPGGNPERNWEVVRLRAKDHIIKFVEVDNSTAEPDGSVKKYLLRVPPETKTVQEGVARGFNRSPKNYNPTKES